MRARAGLRSWAGALLLAAAACGGGGEPLRVGTSADYPPLTFEEGGELRGVEIDFAQRLGEELDRRVELVRIDFDELIPALEQGRIDVVMSGMSITQERARRVRFCRPYQQVGQMALVRSADLERLRPPEAMARPESRVGFMNATTGEKFVRQSVGSAQRVGFPSIEEGVAALRAGRIDYFVHDAPTIWRIVGGATSQETELTGLYRPLTDEHLAWAVRRDDEALGARLDAALERWQAEGRTRQLLDRWIPVRKIAVDPPTEASGALDSEPAAKLSYALGG
jgi:ABC-type amino acid transport substrate-binding protein